EMTSEEREELERRAGGEAPVPGCAARSDRLYAAQGMADTEIAARLDTSPGLVGRWRRRFAKLRLEGLKNRPRSGRPRRFPPDAGRRRAGGGVRAADPLRPAAVAVLAH